MKALRHTDFPDPVVPAMRAWGILARSATKGLPVRSRPRARGSSALLLANSGAWRISRRNTISGFGLGISTPTAPFPGIGATMRMLRAFMANARSASRLAILFTFTPGAGTTSNWVTTGPVVRALTEHSTLKVWSF
jgi:hypothetical protein